MHNFSIRLVWSVINPSKAFITPMKVEHWLCMDSAEVKCTINLNFESVEDNSLVKISTLHHYIEEFEKLVIHDTMD